MASTIISTASALFSGVVNSVDSAIQTARARPSTVECLQCSTPNEVTPQDYVVGWECVECNKTNHVEMCTHCGGSRPASKSYLCSHCNVMHSLPCIVCKSCGLRMELPSSNASKTLYATGHHTGEFFKGVKESTREKAVFLSSSVVGFQCNHCNTDIKLDQKPWKCALCQVANGFARVKCQSCDADRLMAIICTGCLKATTIPSSNFTAELGRMTKSITNNTKLYYYKIRKIEYLTCPRCNHHFQQQKQRSQAHPGKSPGGVQPSGDSEQKNPRVGRNSTDSTSSIPTETGGNRSFFRSSLSSVSSPRASISSRRGSGFDVDGGYAYGDDDADAGVMGGMFDDDLNVGHTATNSQSTRHNGDNDVDDGLSTDGNLIACPKCNFFVYDDE